MEKKNVKKVAPKATKKEATPKKVAKKEVVVKATYRKVGDFITINVDNIIHKVMISNKLEGANIADAFKKFYASGTPKDKAALLKLLKTPVSIKNQKIEENKEINQAKKAIKSEKIKQSTLREALDLINSDTELSKETAVDSDIQELEKALAKLKKVKQQQSQTSNVRRPGEY